MQYSYSLIRIAHKGAADLLQLKKEAREMTILIETTHIQISDSTEPEYLMDDMSGALADVSVSCCTCSCSCCC
jgi:hypothetical protein